MNNKAEHRKAIQSIHRCIDRLQLDLSGLNILTEVGSGAYIYTPLIPLLAGATSVTAFVKDTSYGSSDEIAAQCMTIKNAVEIKGKLEIYKNTLPVAVLQQADVVTNSGMLRPLDNNKLRHLHAKAVIPLMFEKWELRPGDVDVDFCKQNKIPIAGTWEQHPDVAVFSYVGNLAVKMAYEAGCEVRGQNIFVWSDDEFGETISKALTENGANCTTSTNAALLLEMLDATDVIFIADYDENRCYAGADAPFDVVGTVQAYPNVTVVHLYGDIPTDKLNDANIYPKKNGKPMAMSLTLAHLGLEPVLRLQTAGFKVGQELYYNQLSPLSQLI